MSLRLNVFIWIMILHFDYVFFFFITNQIVVLLRDQQSRDSWLFNWLLALSVYIYFFIISFQSLLTYVKQKDKVKKQKVVVWHSIKENVNYSNEIYVQCTTVNLFYCYILSFLFFCILDVDWWRWGRAAFIHLHFFPSTFLDDVSTPVFSVLDLINWNLSIKNSWYSFGLLLWYRNRWNKLYTMSSVFNWSNSGLYSFIYSW
jgi:hypothetical protein